MGKYKHIIFTLLVVLLSVVSGTSAHASKKVRLNYTKKTIYVNETTTIKLLNNKKSVKWSTSNKNIKIISKSKKSAKIKAVKKGTSYLKVKVDKKTYKCKITVKKRKEETTENTTEVTTEQEIYEVISIDLDKDVFTMYEQEERSISYSIFPSYATNKNTTFTSSNTNVATVDNLGKVKAVSKGECTITLKCGSCSASLTVYVYPNIGKRTNPLSAYEENTIDVYDGHDNLGEFKVQLVDLKEGDDVPQYILDEEFNDKPTNTQEYVYMVFKIDYISGEKEVATFNIVNYLSNFFNSQSNVIIEPKGYAYNIDEPSLGYDSVLYPGGSITCVNAIILEKSVMPFTYRIPTGYDLENSDYIYTWFTTKK